MNGDELAWASVVSSFLGGAQQRFCSVRLPAEGRLRGSLEWQSEMWMVQLCFKIEMKEGIVVNASLFWPQYLAVSAPLLTLLAEAR